MDARQIASRFAAYTWYMEVRTPRKPTEAARFARTHWRAFVPVINEGLGKLLERIACESKKDPRIHGREKRTAGAACLV
jgi:hypothetical protein